MPNMGSLFVRRIPLPLIMDPFDILLHSYTLSLVLLMHQTIHSGVSEVSMCDTVQKLAFIDLQHMHTKTLFVSDSSTSHLTAGPYDLHSSWNPNANTRRWLKP